jgi:predicted PurR-regulated permease PerM
MRLLLGTAALLVVVFAARIASPVIAPLCLALVLAIAFEPLTDALTRRGVPRWGAALATTIAILSVVGAFSLMVIRATAELVDTLPRHADQLAALQADVSAWLRQHGLESAAGSVQQGDLAGRVEQLAAPALRSTIDLAQTLVLVVVTTAFIQIDAPGVRATIRRRLRSRRGDPDAAIRLDQAIDEVQRYVIVKGLLSVANGVLLGLWCWAWGVDAPVLWGVMAFALNFVPIVGSLIAALPPVALALVTGGPVTALGVASGYVMVNLVVDNLTEPRVMGRAVNLSPLVILLAMLFWGFVLGPLGALLSVPLTIAVKAGLAAAPSTRWIAALLEEPTQATQATPPSPLPAAYSSPLSSSRR